MDTSILINWTSPFPVLGLSDALLHFYFILNRNSCKHTMKTQAPRSAAYDLGLHCLPMSQKWDARLIWVNKINVNECLEERHF